MALNQQIKKIVLLNGEKNQVLFDAHGLNDRHVFNNILKISGKGKIVGDKFVPKYKIIK